MTIVTVSLAQMGPSSDTKEKNVERIISLTDEAYRQGGNIVCFPELSLTPYFPAINTSDFINYFDTLPNEQTKPLFNFLKNKEISLILPYAEFNGFKYFNSSAIIHKGEVIGHYRKVHLPGSFPVTKDGVSGYERVYFTPGDLGFPVYDLGFAKIGIQICYDRVFPEGFRSLALKGAEIIFTPTAAPKWRGAITWDQMLPIRAYENGIFVAGVNKGGKENGQEFLGHTMMVSPLEGKIINQAKTDGDEVITTEIDLKDVREARKRFPLWRDRIPSLYEPITNNNITDR